MKHCLIEQLNIKQIKPNIILCLLSWDVSLEKYIGIQKFYKK